MTSVQQLEAEIAEINGELKIVQEGLQNDPDSVEFLSLQNDLQAMMQPLQHELNRLLAASAPSDQQPPKLDKKDTKFPPAQTAATSEPTTKHSFKVNDEVLAKYSADRTFYPAKITSITGSSVNPVFTVSFKGYGNTETVSLADLKPLTKDFSRKRKAESSAPPAAATAPSASGVIASQSPASPLPGASTPNSNLHPAIAGPPSGSANESGAPAGDKAYKKIRSKKHLEAGKKSWQDFAQKGKMSKVYKKDSMFRTGEGVNARVGVVGSGQTMRKDPERSRHVYDKDAGDDE